MFQSLVSLAVCASLLLPSVVAAKAIDHPYDLSQRPAPKAKPTSKNSEQKAVDARLAAARKADLKRAADERKAALLAAKKEATRIKAEKRAAAARILAEKKTASKKESAQRKAALLAAKKEALRIKAEKKAAAISVKKEAARIKAEKKAAAIAVKKDAARIIAEQKAIRARYAAEQKAEAAALKAQRKADNNPRGFHNNYYGKAVDPNGSTFKNAFQDNLFSLQEVQNLAASKNEIKIKKLPIVNGSFSRAFYDVTLGGKTYFAKLLTQTRGDFLPDDTEKNRLKALAPFLEQYENDRIQNPHLPKFGRYFTDTEFYMNGEKFSFILFEKVEGKPLTDLFVEVAAKKYKSQKEKEKKLGWFATIGESLANFYINFKSTTSNYFDSVVHGDLHRQNILFDPSKNEVALVDYENMDLGKADVEDEVNYLFTAGRSTLEYLLPLKCKGNVNVFKECYNQIATGYNQVLSAFGLDRFNVSLPYP